MGGVAEGSWLELALIFVAVAALAVPARSVPLLPPSTPIWLIWSDASWDEREKRHESDGPHARLEQDGRLDIHQPRRRPTSNEHVEGQGDAHRTFAQVGSMLVAHEGREHNAGQEGLGSSGAPAIALGRPDVRGRPWWSRTRDRDSDSD